MKKIEASGNLPEISEEKAEAVRLHGEIAADAQAAAYHLIRLGKNLKLMNDRGLYRQLGFESLGEYAQAAVGLKERAAYHYISAYEAYGEEGLNKYGALGITKLVTLIQLKGEDRAELLENGTTESLSTRELQAEVDRLKEKCEQLTFELQAEVSEKQKEINDAIVPIEDERDVLVNQVVELKKTLAEERRTKVLPAPEMTEAEKENIRKEIEAEVEKYYSDEFVEAVAAYENDKSEMKKKSEAAEKRVKELEAFVKQEKDKAEAARREHAELTERLAAAEKEKSELQALADKPKSSGNKESVKDYVAIVQNSFNAAVRTISGISDSAERDKLKSGMKAVLKQLSEAVERC